MCFRKAAGVVPLLQGLTKVQIVSHSRFAAKMGFNTSHLAVLAIALALSTTPQLAAQGVNNALFVSQSVPDSMVAGQSYDVSVTLRNIGTATWTRDTSFRLGSYNPGDNIIWKANGPCDVPNIHHRVYLCSGEAIARGDMKTFSFQVTAPVQAGQYNFQWRMVKEFVEWFGDYSANVAVSVVDPPPEINNAQFISQNVPATMEIGQTYDVSVTMKNTGTTTWTRDTSFRLGSYNPGSNTIWKPEGPCDVPNIHHRVYLCSGEAIAPLETKTFTFQVTAPTQAGEYNFQWRMLEEFVQWFGDYSANVAVSVENPPEINDAQFIGQNVPASMEVGLTYDVSVTMKNTGTTTWTSGTVIRLGSKNPSSNTIWQAEGPCDVPNIHYRVYLCSGDSIAPLETKTFTFQVTAPAQAAEYNFQWGMLQEAVEWFGDLSANVVVSVENPPEINDAQFIGQNLPATMEVGQTYDVSVTMKNTGTTTWTRDTSFRLGSYNPGDNIIWKPEGPCDEPNIHHRVYLCSGDAIAPLETKTFTFQVTAPAQAGEYNFQWRMQQEFVEWFGDYSANVAIQVEDPPEINDAQFIAQNVPDSMEVGESYDVSVTMKNTGTTTWTRATSIKLGSRNPAGNTIWQAAGPCDLSGTHNQVYLCIGDSIANGETKTFTFQVTAPEEVGEYNFQWGMQEAAVDRFGELTPNVAVSVLPMGLKIAQQPQDLIVQRSFSAVFSVLASNGIEPYFYRWQSIDPDSGDWADLAESTNVTGTISDTLTIISCEAIQSSNYRVLVSDSESPPTTIASASAQLTVANSTPGCFLSDPPITDFVADFDEWIAERMDRWELVQTHSGPQVEFRASYYLKYGDYGYIRKSETAAPKGYNTVRIQFASLEQATQMHLAWGPELDQRKGFNVEAGTDIVKDLDLSDFPSWTDAPEIAGFCTRDLVLHFDTRGARGVIERIDVWSGPHLNFSRPLELFIGDHEAETFGAGTTMELRQYIRNDGCDLGFYDTSDQRDISYSLCKTEDATYCHDGFDNCNDGNFFAAGDIYAGGERYYDYGGCLVELPPADPEENLTRWTLSATFTNYSTRPPAVLEFDLVEHGTTNLTILFHEVIEAKSTIDGEYESRAWISTSTPFSIEATIKSQFYESWDVVCEVWARVHDPMIPADEWSENDILGSVTIPYIRNDGVENIVFNDLRVLGLLEIDQPWALMDIMLVLDPFNSIDEGEYEHDNTFAVYDWIPVSVGDLGGAVGELIFEDKMEDPGLTPPFTPSDIDWDYISGEDRLSILPMKPATGEEPKPHLYWSNVGASNPSEISGIMMRFRRDQSVGVPKIHTGTNLDSEVDPHDTLIMNDDDPVGFTSYRPKTPRVIKQWQTVVWVKNNELPFGVCQNPPSCPSMDGFVFRPSEQEEAESLYLAVDAAHLDINERYTGTIIDYIGAWSSGEIGIPFDAEPQRMYENDATLSKALTDLRILPANVMLWSEHELWVEIATSDGRSVDWNDIEVTVEYRELEDSVDAKTELSMSVIDSQSFGTRSRIYRIDGNDPVSANWKPQVEGFYDFVVTVDVAGDTYPNNNGWRSGRVRVLSNCPVPSLTLPY